MKGPCRQDGKGFLINVIVCEDFFHCMTLLYLVFGAGAGDITFPYFLSSFGHGQLTTGRNDSIPLIALLIGLSIACSQ